MLKYEITLRSGMCDSRSSGTEKDSLSERALLNLVLCSQNLLICFGFGFALNIYRQESSKHLSSYWLLTMMAMQLALPSGDMAPYQFWHSKTSHQSQDLQLSCLGFQDTEVTLKNCLCAHSIVDGLEVRAPYSDLAWSYSNSITLLVIKDCWNVDDPLLSRMTQM